MHIVASLRVGNGRVGAGLVHDSRTTELGFCSPVADLQRKSGPSVATRSNPRNPSSRRDPRGTASGVLPDAPLAADLVGTSAGPSHEPRGSPTGHASNLPHAQANSRRRRRQEVPGVDQYQRTGPFCVDYLRSASILGLPIMADLVLEVTYR
jgi:hypothetical protein